MEEEVRFRERLESPPGEDFVKFVTGPKIRREFEIAFEPQMQIHLAHTLMLMKQGIIAQGEGQQILLGLQELARLGVDDIEMDYSLEDLYSHIERHLIRKIGIELGGKMHTGRSRNDMGQTVWRMVLRNRLLEVLSCVLELRSTLLELAYEHINTVMPGYTHGQHAQPITFGYYLSAFADSLERDTLRLEAAYSRVNWCPLGAGALATTGFPIDRHFTAQLLGFEGIIRNGYDAVASRDDAAETLSCFSIMTTNLSRLYQDLHVWCSAEHSFIEIADQYAVVSSIMPQKKNPASLEYLRAVAGYVLGDLVALLSGIKNTSFGFASDVAYAPNDSVLKGAANSILSLTLTKGIMSTLIVKPEAMLEKTKVGFSTMTELADTIVREKGLPFRVAHSIVAKTVAQALEEGRTSTEITTEMLDKSSRDILGHPLALASESLEKALDPVENVRVRKVAGGPAPEELEQALTQAKKKLAEDEKATGVRQKVLESARENLGREVDKAISSS